MKISDNTSIAMPMRNLISIVVAVAVGVWAYFGIVERINTLETSKQLMEADLLKKAEQTPKNLEMLMLIEMNAKILEKHQVQLDDNIHTQVMLNEANKKIEKLQEDVEKLIRNGYKVLIIEEGKKNNNPFLSMPAGWIPMLDGSPYLKFYKSPKKINAKLMMFNNFIPCCTVVYDSSKIGKIHQPDIKKRNDYEKYY